MSTEMTVTQDLRREWWSLIKTGEMVTDYEVTVNGEKQKHLVGLRINAKNEIEEFAFNTATNAEIPGIVEEREVEDSKIILQFNEYRSFKPGSDRVLPIGRQPDIPKGPEKCRFGCQSPKEKMSLIKRNPIADYATTGWHLCTYHNATPFEKHGHFLWIPTRLSGTTYVISHFSQELTPDFLESALTLFRDSSGLIVFFNSLHAGASVDHIHFQAVCHTHRYAIEGSRLEPFGPHFIFSWGPVHGIAFSVNSTSKEIYPFVELLHRKGYPFNLIMLGERIYLIPRDADNEVVSEFPSGVIASMELIGKFIISSRAVYDAATAKTLFTALKKATQEKYRIIALFDSLIKGK